MTESPDLNVIRILLDHKIPRGINLDVDREGLRENLIETGLDKRFVQNLIKILGAGMTLDIDWEFLEDYDREELESRIARRTILKPEVVSDLLDIIYEAYEIKSVESLTNYSFDENDGGLSIVKYDGDSTSIQIPPRVLYDHDIVEITHIDFCAFDDCEHLESIFVPDSVTLIENGFICDCSSLISINVSQDNPYYASVDGVLYSKTMDALVSYPPGKQSTKFTVPDSVVEINAFAFTYCEHLQEIILPNSIRTIGCSAFEGCNKLEQILLPESVCEIEPYAFEDCHSLSSIIIPESVVEIGNGLFKNCISLISIEVNPHVPLKIGIESFEGCTSLTSFPHCEMGCIGDRAFSGCRSLESFHLSGSITRIGSFSFGNCPSLKTIEVGFDNAHYESFDGILFDKGMGTLIRYPPGKTTHSFDVPDSVVTISGGAFQGCTHLACIHISKSVMSIDEGEFSGCNSLYSIEVSSENRNYGSKGGILYDALFNRIIRCPPGINVTDFTIPDSVSKIEPWAFSGCKYLVGITIPDSVDQIGARAFSDCSRLVSVVIPNSVTVIDIGTFWGCSSLESIILPVYLDVIEDIAFLGCMSLISIHIPDYVSMIGLGAFSGCRSLDKKSKEEIWAIEPDSSF